MASSTKNVKLGVCKVFYDGNDLGYTQGGVEFSVTTQTHKVEIDQFGKTAINEYIMGRECKVKIPLAETTLANMALTMPNKNTTGIEGTTVQRLGIDAGVGVDLLANAKLMTLHPYGKLDYDFSDEIVIPLANTAGALQFAYQLENERIFNVDYTGYPDPTTGMLFYAGNPFTDIATKTTAISTIAASNLLTGTGFGASAAASAYHGKAVMVAAYDAAAAAVVAPVGLTYRKLYYAKWISATTIELHLAQDLSDAAVTVATGAVTGVVKVTVLA